MPGFQNVDWLLSVKQSKDKPLPQSNRDAPRVSSFNFREFDWLLPSEEELKDLQSVEEEEEEDDITHHDDEAKIYDSDHQCLNSVSSEPKSQSGSFAESTLGSRFHPSKLPRHPSSLILTQKNWEQLGYFGGKEEEAIPHIQDKYKQPTPVNTLMSSPLSFSTKCGTQITKLSQPRHSSVSCYFETNSNDIQQSSMINPESDHFQNGRLVLPQIFQKRSVISQHTVNQKQSGNQKQIKLSQVPSWDDAFSKLGRRLCFVENYQVPKAPHLLRYTAICVNNSLKTRFTAYSGAV